MPMKWMFSLYLCNFQQVKNEGLVVRCMFQEIFSIYWNHCDISTMHHSREVSTGTVSFQRETTNFLRRAYKTNGFPTIEPCDRSEWSHGSANRQTYPGVLPIREMKWSIDRIHLIFNADSWSKIRKRRSEELYKVAFGKTKSHHMTPMAPFSEVDDRGGNKVFLMVAIRLVQGYYASNTLILVATSAHRAGLHISNTHQTF